MTSNLVTGVLVKEMTVIDLCRQHDISKELLIELIEQGVFSLPSSHSSSLSLDEKVVHRIEAALRLHRDLQINWPGVALAVELIEEIETLHQELDILRKHF